MHDFVLFIHKIVHKMAGGSRIRKERNSDCSPQAQSRQQRMTESEEGSFIHALHKYVILSLFLALFLYLCKFLYVYPTVFPTITPQFVRKENLYLFLWNIFGPCSLPDGS